MKLTISLLIVAILALTAIAASAQTPQLINYQAVARNSSGGIMANQSVSVRLTIHDSSASGNVQYQETQSLTTNAYGLFAIQIGGGSVTNGSMEAVTWSNGIKYLQIEMDPAGGTSYVDMGTQQLISVPYAFYTSQAGSAATLTGNVAMGGDVTGTNSAATVAKLQGKNISTAAPATGQYLEWNGTAWTPATIPAPITYTSGTGVTITGSVVSAQNTSALWNADELQGNAISTISPATGQVLSWNGAAWVPAASGTVTSVIAGAGLAGGTITGSGTISMPNVGTPGTYGSATQVPVITTDAQGRVMSITNTGVAGDNWGPQIAHTDATLAGSGTTAVPLRIAQQGAVIGQALEWNGISWVPTTIPAPTTYTSGTGINITGSVVNAQNTTALWNANELQGKNISATAPAAGQGLVWNGSAWTPTTLAAGTTYTSGTGINIAGSVVSAQNTTALWNADQLQGNTVSATIPTSGQVLSWSGSAWTPTTPATGTTYTSGTGINIAGTVVNAQNTTALWNADELQGNTVSATAPTSGQVLSWSGSAWTPATPAAGTTYTSGTGINIAGSVVNAQNTAALWNADELQGNNVSNTAPTAGQGLVWSGSAWTPTTLAAGTSYTSGTGINIAGSVVNAQNTTALWNANELQGNNVSSTLPTAGQGLVWNGSAWTPTTLAAGTTYTSGTGINISGSVVNAQNTTALWNANELQGNSVSVGVPISGQVLTWGGSSWAPASVPGDNWGSQVVQTDATLTGNGTSVTPLQLAQHGATAGQVLTWTGSAWLPGSPSSSGWSLTGNTGTTPGTNFIGTTDAEPIVFKVNSQWSGEITNTSNTSLGYRSLGVSTPTGTDNTAFGNQALSSTTSGNNSTAVGFNALYSNTTGADSHTAVGSLALQFNINTAGNTAVGYAALENNTTGFGGTAVGSNSLMNNTSGEENTAIGGGSLQFNTGGNYNTGAGYYTLYSNTSGGNNTAVGYLGLYSNTTGANNVAMGFKTLYNSTGSYNSAIGSGALLGNTTGTDNTAIGYNALYNNTTASYNTAAGSGAMYYTTTGARNSAYGYQSLLSNTTGFDNTAIGYGSMMSNITGQDNVAGGYNALTSNTTGSSNIAIGSLAMSNNTTGYNNDAVGYHALTANTTGIYNSAEGWFALSANTTGSDNVGVGALALSTCSTGSYNTATGESALSSSTTGNNNSAFGYQALTNSTTGNDNTANGYNALVYNTTGYSNVAIGTNALYNSTAAHNLVAVGDSALYNQGIGVGANTALGSKVLYSTTSGTYNTASGYQSMYSNSIGTYNTAYGSLSLFHNTTASDNSAFGYQALTANTTGASNTAVGFNTLIANTTASNNTAFGANALGNITTGANNTGLGYNAYPTASATLTNWTAIGYNAGGAYSTSNSVELGNTSVATIRAQVTGITAISIDSPHKGQCAGKCARFGIYHKATPRYLQPEHSSPE